MEAPQMRFSLSNCTCMNLPKREELLFLTVLAFPIQKKDKKRRKKEEKKLLSFRFFVGVLVEFSL